MSSLYQIKLKVKNNLNIFYIYFEEQNTPDPIYGITLGLLLLLLSEEQNTMETRYPNRRYQLAGAKVTIIGTLTCPMVERSLLSFVRLYDSVGEGVRFGAFRVLENHYIVLKDKVQSSGINGPKWNRVDTDSLTK